jgi:hypothetical protein
MTTGGEPLRIGTSERSAAMKALDEHLSAGRLTVEEYGERSATAANARVASELTTLFTDIPAPHPALPGAVVPASTAPLPAVGDHGAASGTVEKRRSGTMDSWGPRVVAISPFVALAVFFVGLSLGWSYAWIAFLLIPATGALVYGGGVGHDDDDDRNRDRDARRAERRDRRDRR